MVDEPHWVALGDEDLRRVRVMLKRAFLATLAVLVVAGLVVEILALGRDPGPVEPSPQEQVRALYRPGAPDDLRCTDPAGPGWRCSYRLDRYTCSYEGAGRPDCSLHGARRSGGILDRRVIVP